METREIGLIISELRKCCPLQLDDERTYPTPEGSKSLGFPDDHQFVVSLPAWVFRRVKALQGSPREVRTLAEGSAK